MCVFSNVCLFLQTLQVFGSGGKRSSRWLLAFGRQPESKTRRFVKLFLRDLSTADDSGSAPAFARVCALVSIYFYIECVGKVTPCCKISVNFAVVSQNHIVLPRFLFLFSWSENAQTFWCLSEVVLQHMQEQSISRKKSENKCFHKGEKCSFSLILRNCRTTLIFFSKYLM